MKGFSAVWPPTAKDMDICAAESSIPVPLYNLLAWVTGLSEESTLDHFVDMQRQSHMKLLSLLQDIVYSESRGTKPTAKSYSLGMTLRHLTGSSKVIDLIHRLGHCASRTTIVAMESALAQLQLNSCADFVPARIAEGQHTILVWDNIYFNEETSSGRGTTHNTNGIVIQMSQHELSGPATEVRPLISKRQRTLRRDNERRILEYKGKKRQGPVPLSVSGGGDAMDGPMCSGSW